MKLFYSPGACSLSPHIALREAGLAFELHKVDLSSKRTDDGRDFTSINRKGYVPALQLDDGEVLTEGPAIVQLIADLRPSTRLAPPNGTRERYRLQEALNFVSTELHKSFSPLFKAATDAGLRTSIVAGLEKKFDVLAEQLAETPFICGSDFTVADAYLFTVLNWTSSVKISLDAWPVLAAYLSRIEARPGVQAAMRAEGLISRAQRAV